ncbi:MAG: MATE family efflux transporter, partial [Lachnospiraceae bacterium]|nr:MATE family efflux transporter [Lachnospiraceae bacterium]
DAKKNTYSIVDENRNPWLTILALSWPIFLEQVLTSLVQAVDTAMVGSMGAVATTSVSISQSPNMLVNGIVMAMGVGFTSLIARSVGAGEMDRARTLIRQAILMVFCLGIPLSAMFFILAREIPMWMGGEPEILDSAEIYNQIIAISMCFRCLTMVLTAIYRGFGDSKTPMKINVMVNLANVVGNFLMIFPTREITVFGITFTMFGLGWGVAGAAASTSISTIIGALILLAVCFIRKSEMQISLKDSFAPNPKELKLAFHLAIPAMIQRFVMSSCQILVTSTVATLGTAAVAAQSLSATAESLSFMPGFAFSTACMTLYGQSLGAKRPDMAHDYLMRTIKLGNMVMAVMTCILFFGSTQIMGLFTPDPLVIEYGSVWLKILALIQIPQTIGFCVSGALQGAGDTKTPLYITFASMWGVRVLGIMICVHLFHLGQYAICVCMCTDNVVRCLLFLMQYKKKRAILAQKAMAR